MARVYLSKKIGISNGVHIRSVCCNPDEDWIAFGGQDGLTKVFKLEQSGTLEGAKMGNTAGLSNFSMNQSLEGHSGHVACMAWNTAYRRLVSSDTSGIIIVWALHKRTWYKTMINRRENSTVQDMCWTSDGTKICIIYDDGVVIVSSIKGNRLWRKDLGMRLKNAKWSPDGQTIIFVSNLGRCVLYDSMGNKLKTLSLRGLSICERSDGKDGSRNGNENDILGEEKYEDGGDKLNIGNIDWYDGGKGYIYNGVPTLAIGLCDGRVQVSAGVEDETPLSVRTGLCLKHVKWNFNGSVLALGGKQISTTKTEDKQQKNIVKFYTPSLKHIYSLSVPGEHLNSISWEGTGQRIALAVDEFIYFASVHPEYLWDYAPSASVIAYAHHKQSQCGSYVTFWDIRSQECTIKQVSHLNGLRGAGELFCLVSEYKECTEGTKNMANSKVTEHIPTQTVTLCNSIGQNLKVRNIKIDVIDTAMSYTHFALAGVDAVYVWQYKPPKVDDVVTSINGSGGDGPSSNCTEHIIEMSGGQNHSVITIESYRELMNDKSRHHHVPKKNRRICCLTISDIYLVVAKEGGEIFVYDVLPTLTFKTGLYSPTELNEMGPKVMKLNFKSQLLAMVDNSGVMGIVLLCGCDTIDPSTPKSITRSGGENMNEEWWTSVNQRGGWDICWSTDDPNQLAVMEKNKLHILEEGVDGIAEPNVGNLCHMENLEVLTVRLCDIMAAPEIPNIAFVERKETRLLRNTKETVATIGLAGAYSYICSQDPPPRRLWQVLAESSLEALELSWALKAFVHCHDFGGIRFVQRLIKLQDRAMQRAEISAWFGRYNEAEALYQDMGRKDLAIDLRRRLDDWFRIVQLLKQGGKGDGDVQMAAALNEIGHYYRDGGCWTQASEFYNQAGNVSMYAESQFRMEDYEALTELLASLPHDSPELIRSGNRLARMGLLRPATDALVQSGDSKGAVDIAVAYNAWDVATDLEEAHGLHQIDGVLAGKTAALLRLQDPKNERVYHNKLLAAELYRNANRPTEAALTLVFCFCPNPNCNNIKNLATECARTCSFFLLAKKLHVLAALEVKRQHNKLMTVNSKDASGLLPKPMSSIGQRGEADDPRDMKVLDAAWRGAEAYHFLILIMRQLYDGDAEMAMHTAIHCVEFHDVLEPIHIYSLLAFAAYHCGFYGICSKAMMQICPIHVLTLNLTDHLFYPIKLETLPWKTKREKETIQTIAIGMFSVNKPVDPEELPRELLDCLHEGRAYQSCVSSGILITKSSHNIMCQVCQRYSIESELGSRNNCPLCHASF